MLSVGPGDPSWQVAIESFEMTSQYCVVICAEFQDGAEAAGVADELHAGGGRLHRAVDSQVMHLPDMLDVAAVLSAFRDCVA